MVETGLAPFLLAMAVFTFFTELLLVNVLFFMTGITGAFGLAVGFLRHMAGAAGGLDMGALEGVVSLAVVELILVKLNHICITAQVIAVTLFAFDTADLVCQAMEAAFVLDVGGDFLVTIQTEAALGFFAKGLVTLIALLLVLGMPLDHLAWHHQRFPGGCMSRA